jgi:hypothetical protein
VVAQTCTHPFGEFAKMLNEDFYHRAQSSIFERYDRELPRASKEIA